MGRSRRFNNTRLSGILLIDKSEGPTSFAVVRDLQRATLAARIGHTGTLDPMATGLLAVCLNKATKLTPFLQAQEKVYQGEILLGLRTDTDDITGQVVEKRTSFDLTDQDVLAVAAEFEGVIEQVPPDYSATKHQGVPAYKLARMGLKVPARARQVTVHSLHVTGIDLPRVFFVTRVSKGAYIRSLAADLGRRLGTGGCLAGLRRLSSGPFSVAKALTLDEALDLGQARRLGEHVIPPEDCLAFLPAVSVDQGQARLVMNGQSMPRTWFSNLNQAPADPALVRVLGPEQRLLAVYEQQAGPNAAELKPVRILGSANDIKPKTV